LTADRVDFPFRRRPATPGDARRRPATRGDVRRAFRDGLPFDQATWARVGWAIWTAMIVLVRALESDLQDAAVGEGVTEAISADYLARMGRLASRTGRLAGRAGGGQGEGQGGRG